ncbi:ribosome maturation factor RimM [Campylobacter upsaliensis]|uniref:ribosome maturation factor RimM n=1 Tax=Campylobacter upsaliensis TaxID=28080 RepID=UPI00214A6512|nr:ribosome maturation factor RimM [Campylobacter upsaliensis]MCR2107364.1 ribosome maturation factor RimM [Campylobacter upsaliensis]
MSKFVLVAKIGRSVGLRGYLKLHNLSDFPSQFQKNLTFFTKDKRELVIKDYDKNRQSVLFYTYESLEKTKNLVNLELYQSIEKTRELCKLKKNEFFYFDIIGCEVRDEQIILGQVQDILESGGGYLFEIKSDEKLTVQGFSKIFFIPYIDKYILQIDIEKKQILCSNEAFYILENS